MWWILVFVPFVLHLLQRFKGGTNGIRHLLVLVEEFDHEENNFDFESDDVLDTGKYYAGKVLE